jgi:hypothetical protein
MLLGLHISGSIRSKSPGIFLPALENQVLATASSEVASAISSTLDRENFILSVYVVTETSVDAPGRFDDGFF